MAGVVPAILRIRGSDSGGDLADVCGGEGFRNFGLGAFRQGQERGAHCCVLEDTAVHQAPLQGDGALHVGAAVVNVLGHWQQPLMNGVGTLVVLRLAGLDQFDEQFGAMLP